MIARQTNCIRQSGVIPYRVRNGRLEIALVTARLDGRWVIPKGHLEPDLTPHESAAQEAYEEAGLRGCVGRRIIGHCVYEKRGEVRVVEVYALEVQTVLRKWPEMHKRQRRWMSIDEAVERIEHPGLRECLHRFARSLARSLKRELNAAAA